MVGELVKGVKLGVLDVSLRDRDFDCDWEINLGDHELSYVLQTSKQPAY